MKALVPSLALTVFLFTAHAQTQSTAAADEAIAAKKSKALAEAGIDSRITSIKVITTSDHVVYLTGLISDKDRIKLATQVAAKTAPSFRIVNQIHSGFFDDPNHVRGGMTK